MAKFKMLKEGTNKTLIKKTNVKVTEYLSKIVKKDEFIKVDDIFSFNFGTVTVSIRVAPWHTKDVLVEVFANVARNVKLTNQLSTELLRLNAKQPFGAFGLSYDNTIVYSYSLAGANLDYNELMAAVQTVATISDDYAERLKK